MRALFNKIFRKAEKSKIDMSQECQDEPKIYDLYFEVHRLSFPKEIFLNPIGNQIIYIPGNLNHYAECNRYFAENLYEVKELFRSQGYDFFYLPEFAKNITEFVKYNKPDTTPEEITYIADNVGNREFDILSYAKNGNALWLCSPAFMRYVDSNETDVFFSHFTIEPIAKPEYITYKDIVKEYMRQMAEGIIRYSLVKPKADDIADCHFSKEAQKLINEVRDKLALLRHSGVSEMLLKELFEPTEKLSSLYIGSDYRIFLPDYNNIEIGMEPLNKAVFLLFLRHEEGIIFKHLVDYKDELTEIYEKITRCRCDKKQRQSIERICDPTNNSINEKCARIREAFVSQFDERLAKNYFVTGDRGEAKKIILPRELLIFESSKTVSEEQIVQAFVDAWNKKDATLLTSYLKTDFRYSSFWVYDEIKTAAEYLEYLSGKFATIQRTGSIVQAKKANSVKPSIIIKQDSGDPAAIILEIENGLTVRADMMPVDFVR